MLAVFDELPHFCPGCGEEIAWHGSMAREQVREATHGVSQACRCGVSWAVIGREAIRDAATTCQSDLARYT